WVQDVQLAGVSNGLVKALAPGQTTVFAAYGGYESSIPITLVPVNTYVLAGFVKEPGDLLIDSASVEIVGGHDGGRRTTSNIAGYFVFFGVSGSLQLSVSKSGSVTQTI